MNKIHHIGRLFGLFSVLLTVILISGPKAFGQGERHVIQLSGIILSEEDTTRGLPGVHIYVPKAGRGTTSNNLGYFSMPVLPGDEVVISTIGYEKQYYKIPNIDKQSLTIIVEMVSDTTYLREVTIMPFPTEEVLKEAVLALNLPERRNIAEENMSAELLALMIETTPMDGAQNARWYLNNWAAYQGDRFGPRPNPLLNPFNWAQFFKSLKKNKDK
ncbi:carboxypeptidase-like regulatory domain-containing protein [Fulvivirga sedimenti]|uniref:Carboxypeptidase-like regulatory domain-containing protein n=1 Tax=Fulvivirga sedimenti TaxID=2879465 RepID=A0A9X1HMC8_9BACT|nr:carboxypeptidase-like regulatory domain-containing protein [Fulvivirga sedimenti]MCA6074066.1 carboxypeptidase-like regulatory domain-containing protein [Fulvivirga sedimenti]